MAFITFQPSDYFNSVLYTGNNSSSKAVTGVGFQPDWVWIKSTNLGDSHRVYDAVRGAANYITPNANVAQSSSIPLTSFDSDGFTIGSSDGSVNGNYNYVSWNWKAGTTGSGTTGGSGTAKSYSYSVNTTSGLSIIKYVGNGTNNHQIPHHLGAVPKFIWFKNEQAGYSWDTYHHSIGNAHRLYLNASNASASATNFLNSTTPTSTYINLGDAGHTNHSGTEHVAYCFAEKKGFSRFGLYKGNGSTSGTFVFTGFKPGLVIVKRTDDAANWVMTDNVISFNGKGTNESSVLFPSASTVETDAYGLQLYSNGFRFQGSDSASATVNGSGASYIYLAFAAEPFVASNEDPTTAN
jgi:hypothetical protein